MRGRTENKDGNRANDKMGVVRENRRCIRKRGRGVIKERGRQQGYKWRRKRESEEKVVERLIYQ